jgi:Flp pilus assembly protein TadG
MGKQILQFSRNLWHDTSGVILPYVTVMLVVIIGLALLAVDGARYQSLQTQMQAAADAAALAGAAELNGQTGARSRATAAINNYLSNQLSGMGITTAVQHSAPAYYSALPAANQLPSNGTAATDDADAHFVLVTITPVTVPTLFPVSFLAAGATNSFSAGAQAVAGMDENICGIPPVYVCNPWEGTGTSLSSALANQAQIRKQLQLLNDGTNGPGHFGWLVPPDGNVSASNLQEWISVTSPKTCYSTNTVNLNVGAKQSTLNGFNVRLDIGADGTHAPDVNVRKGYAPPSNGNFCNATTASSPTTSRALPQDACYASGTCPFSYQGDGQWDCASYWSTEHNPASAPAPAVNEFGQSRVCGTTATTTFTRYEIYRYEITQNKLTDWSRGSGNSSQQYTNSPINKAGENGQPLCLGASSGVAGRRAFPVAVINCTANSALMGNGGVNAVNIPVEAFANFFISEPVNTTGAASNRKLIGEFTGGVNLNGNRYQNVKLYR